MVFSSPLFLFLFLPIVLTVCLCLPGVRARNTWLLLVSIVFYAWGEIAFVLLMLGSTVMNYYLGLWVDRTSEPVSRKWAVAVTLMLNLGLLAFFKYANFVVVSLNATLRLFAGPQLPDLNIPLPIGISFFTFHAISYVIDVYRRKWRAASDPRDVALYIFFFPQLIAGPILRWNAIAPQLVSRTVNREEFGEGVRRFVGGLAKKVLIANVVAVPADQIFGLPTHDLSPQLAWLGVLCYSLQIYFDFSGYSDMAVGLGKMFGFKFLENFNFPYVAQSVKDFWHRWHISLSTWFRDYLYVPMGGNRCSEPRNYFNLVTVFFLCGLWHGASWTFVVWGLYHGLFLVLERTRFGIWENALPRVFRHGYALLVVSVGWVLFRTDSFAQALSFLKAMAGFVPLYSQQPVARYLTHEVAVAILVGILFSMPVWGWVRAKARVYVTALNGRGLPVPEYVGLLFEGLLVIGLFVTSAAWLASGTYNPFIYFRF